AGTRGRPAAEAARSVPISPAARERPFRRPGRAWRARSASAATLRSGTVTKSRGARTPGAAAHRQGSPEAPASSRTAPGEEPGDVEAVEACGIAADALRLLGLGHAGEDLRDDLPRLRERGLAVGVVGAPHHVVHADDVAQADADRVLLEAQDDV